MLGNTDVSTLRITSIDPLTDARWEAFVGTQPDSQAYHHPAWLCVLQEAFGYRPAHLSCEDADGHIQGILPLFATHGLLNGRSFSSLPRTPVAGPLARSAQAMVCLLSAATDLTHSHPGTYLQLKLASNALDGLVECVVGVPWRTAYVLELPDQPAALRIGAGENRTRIKWAVSKAIRHGVQVRVAETERELRKWYDLYLDTMRWHAVPPRPYRFFSLIWEHLRPRNLMRLLLAEQHAAGRSKLLAGTLYLTFGQTVVYAFTGRDLNELALHPNDAIHWHAIHDAHAEGFRYYDFGEVT